MNNGFTHNQARIPAARVTDFALATLLLVCGAFLLTSCGHEPEKATPPAQTETQNTNAASTGANEKASSAEEGNVDKAADEKASQDDSAKAAKHQGAYAIAIRNGGGADGLPYAHLLTALDSFRRGITIAQRHSADSQQNKSKNFHSDINVKT